MVEASSRGGVTTVSSGGRRLLLGAGVRRRGRRPENDGSRQGFVPREARDVVEARREDCNDVRLHRSPAGRTPSEHARALSTPAG